MPSRPLHVPHLAPTSNPDALFGIAELCLFCLPIASPFCYRADFSHPHNK